MKIGVKGLTNDEFAALGFLLYPYKVELSREVEGSDLTICRGSLDSSRPLIRLRTCASPSVLLESKNYDSGIVDYPYDLIRGCLDRLEAVMNPRAAFMYRLGTHLPFQYGIVPSWIRDRVLRMRSVDQDLSHHLASERARAALRKAFDILGFRLKRKNPPSFLITHDVDTKKGLWRALSLKAVEDELNVQSTWFLLSHEYHIGKAIAADLADGSVIGSHDKKHDGRLVHIQKHADLVRRIMESRLRLEEIFEKEVRCFRSPLLQFSRKIVSALGEAGYKFDFSVPCWEPIHPSTMSGFGIESLQAFETNGVVEVPLTLFQDHQVLNLMGMSTDQAIRLWVDQATLISALEGDIVLLIHPDYCFSSDLQKYRELLTILLEIHATRAAS